jgi:hypothetical protein
MLTLTTLALFNQLLLYFSPRVSVAFRYDEGWSKQTAQPSALRLRISSTKVTISASNHNASKEVLEKFKHPCERNPKKRYSRNFLLSSEGRYLSPSLGLGCRTNLGGCRLLHT